MPAERQRRTKKTQTKTEDAGMQLTWTTPVVDAEPVSIPALVSAPADVAVHKFAIEPPVPSATPDEPALFPPLDPNDPNALPSKPHGRKKDDNHVPRPPNAFILFRASFIKSNHIASSVEGDHSTLSKIIGITWQNMPDEERQFWHGKAKVAQDEHKRKFPGYTFRPHQARAQAAAAPPKRRMREVAPKDPLRCARIAELLVEGKKGADLERAMAEFDATNVKPVVARFEEPLTARQFRKRSCSQPPELESSSAARQARFTPSTSPSKPSKRRLRASSSQPTTQCGKRASRTVPSTPAPSTPAPSTPAPTSSLSDIAEDFSNMPPLVLPPVNPDLFPAYSAGDLQSFNFDIQASFVFDESQTTQVDPCAFYDPLAQAPRPASSMSSDSLSQSSVAPAYAPTGLSIDTSFYDSFWPAPSSSPSPCTPSTSYGADQPPPFSTAASSPATSAPEYSFAGYTAIPNAFDTPGTYDASSTYDAYGFAPAPPYAEAAPYVAPVGDYERPAKAAEFSYPHYAHKLPAEDITESQLYATGMYTTYSM